MKNSDEHFEFTIKNSVTVYVQTATRQQMDMAQALR